MTGEVSQGRAHGWVAHLRAGGTTPWLGWTAPADPTGPLPGAQQLELLRRVNAAAQGRPRPGLADRVLGTPAAGRGKADLSLVGVDAAAWGPRPVDPASLGPRELLRVASVLLAEDLVRLGTDPTPTAWPRPWRRRLRLVGDPLVVAGHRRDLAARGRPEGGRRPVLVVVGAPLDELLAHTWTQRCFETGTQPWAEWLRFWRERDQLPARADLPASVERWPTRRRSVRIVTDRDRLPGQLGVSHLPQVLVPGADQAELARRVAAVVGLMVPAPERPPLMRTLQLRMPGGGSAPVAVPEGEQEWVAAAAARSTRTLTRAGYPVVGDLADLAPTSGPHPVRGGASDQQVLDLAIRMVADTTWRTRPAERQVDR